MNPLSTSTRKTLSPYASFEFSIDDDLETDALLIAFADFIHTRLKKVPDFDRAILAAARHKDFDRLFTYDPKNIFETFSPLDHILYPSTKEITTFTVRPDSRLQHDQDVFDVSIESRSVMVEIADTLRWLASDQHDAPASIDLIEQLEEIGCIRTEDVLPVTDNPYARNGIHRLQHASLLYVHGGISILIDPVLHSSGYGEETDPAILQASMGCSAVLISHSHGDHFSLSSMAFFPRDTPIIVPKVDRANLLCTSFAEPLRAMGFVNVIETGWWDTAFELGGMRIVALPFYGEQPRSDGALRAPDLRNIGNTYLIEAGTNRTWIIVDTGDEFDKSMRQLAVQVEAKFGQVTHIASNLRKFPIHAPDYVTGTGSYWASLSNHDILHFSSFANEYITLGPDGVAHVIAACNCKNFIPYADWWGNLNQPSALQARLTQQLRLALDDAGADCVIIDVSIGGLVQFNE